MRKDEDFLNSNKSDLNSHIKSVCPLLKLGIGLVSQVPLQPMHLIYLGVVKRLLLNYFVEGNKSYKLSQTLLAKINETSKK